MQRPALLLLPLALTLAIAACSPAEPPAAAEAPATPAATADAPAPAAEPAPADAAPVEGVSGTYLIDPNHTNVVAQWSHFGFSNPIAHFGEVDGAITYDPPGLVLSSHLHHVAVGPWVVRGQRNLDVALGVVLPSGCLVD